MISQVYGGGGNTGAPYLNDFVEIFNPTTGAIPLTGLSVQYASATGTGNFGGTTTQITPLSGTLGAGQYLLVQEAAGTTASPPPPPLPTPDITDSSPIDLSGTNGKVALLNSTTTLGCNGNAVTTPCTGAQLALIIDLVGYGNATFFEGAAAAPTLSNTTAALRGSGGCTDTDVNGADFTAAAPTPRNTASPLKSCVTGVNLSINDVSLSEGNAGTTSFNFTVSLSSPAPAGGVTFDIATQDNSAAQPGDYALKSLTSQTIPATNSTYAFSVLVSGDADIEPNETFFVNVTNVTGTGVTVTDGQGQGTILNDDAVTCTSPVTPIYAIQGSGASAAITGNVTTEGIVVGDFEGGAAAGGFFIQDPTGDANAATSDGIFVFTGTNASAVNVGDKVRVTGFARERFNQTTLNGSDSNTVAVTAASILNCGAGSVSATDVSLPFTSATFPERYEGMLVRFPQPLVIAEYFNYDQFGEIVLANPRGQAAPAPTRSS